MSAKVKIDTLKEMLSVENAVAAPLDDFDLVVEPLNKSTVVTRYEVVRDFVFTRDQGFDKAIEAMNGAALDAGHPAIDPSLRLRPIDVLVEDIREFVSEGVGTFQKC